jgi:Leucine-rich repeat (LRR) protein
MGNQASVNKHLENAQRTGVFTFNKSNITEFPKDVVKVKDNIRSLDVSVNKLKTIPDYIGSFTNLKHLNLSSNRLHAIPDTVGNLKKLETLDVSCNLLTALPTSLSKLANLRTLTLKENALTSFPLQVVGLKHLEVIDLSKNKISEISDGIEDLQSTELNLNQNQITKISSSIASCPRLKVLRIEENCLPITGIPPKLLSDSQVNLISFEGNLFEAKDFQGIEGHDKYLERFTASKKKLM